MNCCNEYGDCRQGRDCPVRKGVEMPKIEIDYPKPVGLRGLLLILCITFVVGCVWFYKVVL